MTFRSPGALRVEQRAWLKLRDAWVDFLGTLFPGLSQEERSNMSVGARAFELETRAKYCHRSECNRSQDAALIKSNTAGDAP